jgi:hypothetical protein
MPLGYFWFLDCSTADIIAGWFGFPKEFPAMLFRLSR